MSFQAALPHGPVTRIAEGIHIVRGSFPMAPGVRIGRTMTIIEQAGGLVVLNAVRLSAEGEAELDRLGKVEHLVKLSDSHSLDEPYYANRYRPEVWALDRAKLSGITATKQLGPESPVKGGVVLEYPGTSGWRECALLTKSATGTLVTCDALQNHADSEGASFLGRIMTPLLGFKGEVIVASMWRRFQGVSGSAVKTAFANVLEHSFENLVTGHGPAVVGGADEIVRGAVRQAS